MMRALDKACARQGVRSNRRETFCDFQTNVEYCVLLMLCLSQYRNKLTIRMKVPANSARNSLAGCDLILIIVDILKRSKSWYFINA